MKFQQFNPTLKITYWLLAFLFTIAINWSCRKQHDQGVESIPNNLKMLPPLVDTLATHIEGNLKSVKLTRRICHPPTQDIIILAGGFSNTKVTVWHQGKAQFQGNVSTENGMGIAKEFDFPSTIPTETYRLSIAGFDTLNLNTEGEFRVFLIDLIGDSLMVVCTENCVPYYK